MYTIKYYELQIFCNFPFDSVDCFLNRCSSCKIDFPEQYLSCFLEKFAYDYLYYFK